MFLPGRDRDKERGNCAHGPKDRIRSIINEPFIGTTAVFIENLTLCHT